MKNEKKATGRKALPSIRVPVPSGIFLFQLLDLLFLFIQSTQIFTLVEQSIADSPVLYVEFFRKDAHHVVKTSPARNNNGLSFPGFACTRVLGGWSCPLPPRCRDESSCVSKDPAIRFPYPTSARIVAYLIILGQNKGHNQYNANFSPLFFAQRIIRQLLYPPVRHLCKRNGAERGANPSFVNLHSDIRLWHRNSN